MARGVPRQVLLDYSGLSLAELADPNGRIPERGLHLLWKRIGEACPGEAFALHLAQAVPFTDFGVLTHAIQYTRTLREALQLFARFGQVMVGSIRITFIDGADAGYLRLHHPLDTLDGGHGAEMALALGARLGRAVFGSANPLARVDFTHAPHGPIDAYTAAFGAPVSFGCPANVLVFRSDALDRPSQTSDRYMLQYLHHHLEQTRARLLAAGGGAWLEDVRAAIATNAQRGDYRAEALADRLGMSVRTLQRKLKREGHHAAALLDAAREANARALLGDRRLTIEEVAFLLGYSSARAFRRACQRWTGAVPGAYRESLQV